MSDHVSDPLTNFHINISRLESLGKIAYSRYRSFSNGKSLATGQSIPEWEGLKPEIKEAWIASSTAVIDEFQRTQMMPEMTFSVVFADGLKNHNDHIYSANAWDSAIKKVAEKKCFVQLPIETGTSGISMRNICGIVTKIEIFDVPGFIYQAKAEIKILDTMSGKILMNRCQSQTGKNLYIAPEGTGIVEDDHIQDYEFQIFTVAEESAFISATPFGIE